MSSTVGNTNGRDGHSGQQLLESGSQIRDGEGGRERASPARRG